MNWMRTGMQLLVMGSAVLVASVYVLTDSEPSPDEHIETGVVGKSFVVTATDTARTESAGGVSAVKGAGGNDECRSCTTGVSIRLEPPAMMLFGLGLIGVSQLVKRKKTTSKQS
ncbi:MAG: hypothetical protein IH612_01785 [Desulfofustis sp.]|nr:hypothetical protein [Desulfofustis sp.]